MYDLLIKNGRLVTPDRIFQAEIGIRDGKYAAFLEPGTNVEAKEVIDAKGNYVFPGIIDCHAHLNEPGFEYREDFETGSRAAAAAGCTTLIDMPLNNDPSLINREVFDIKLSMISRHSYVDFALWGGIVGDYDDQPGSIKNNMDDLEEEGLIDTDSRKDLLGNTLTLIATAEAADKVSMDALTTDAVTQIAIGEPETVPAGNYATQVFENMGITDQVESKLVQAKDVRAVLNYVETGDADCGFVYRTDALMLEDGKGEIIADVDESLHDPIVYPAALIKDSPQPEAAADFYKYLETDYAKGVFEKYGFTVK